MEIKNYKSFDELLKYIKVDGCDDYFKIEGVIYTMEEYDHVGEYIRFANKKHNKGFIVETSNRYGQNKFKDAHLEFCDEWDWFRNDIQYYE